MEALGVSSLILMENAAFNVVNHIAKRYPKNIKITVLCGKGNNGGDGFAIARGLFARGYSAAIVPWGDFSKATPDCKTNLNSAKAMNIPFTDDYISAIKSADIVVDALIGTGLSSPMRQGLAELCKAVNEYSKYTISADCPTGINSDTGEVYENAVKADLTYTFHAPKAGLLLYPAKDLTGKLRVGSIGIPVTPVKGSVELSVMTKEDAAGIIPKRVSSSNKGTYGRVAAFSGSGLMSGAAVLNLSAAYRAGAGLVCGVCTETVARVIQNSLTEAVVKIAEDEKGYLTPAAYKAAQPFLTKSAVVLAGSGLGVTPSTKALVQTLINNVSSSLILDADALNCIADNPQTLAKSNADIIITPHVGEMSRLTGKTTGQIKADPINTAVSFSQKYNVTTVLKDAVTIIASPEGKAAINTTGTPAMSKGGTGDVLAGTIAALSAQKLSAFEAAVLGAYITGKAGEAAAKKHGLHGTLAREICKQIPKIMAKTK